MKKEKVRKEMTRSSTFISTYIYSTFPAVKRGWNESVAGWGPCCAGSWSLSHFISHELCALFFMDFPLWIIPLAFEPAAVPPWSTSSFSCPDIPFQQLRCFFAHLYSKNPWKIRNSHESCLHSWFFLIFDYFLMNLLQPSFLPPPLLKLFLSTSPWVSYCQTQILGCVHRH